MNRSGRDYHHLVGGRNFLPGSLNLRRGHSLTGGAASAREADEDLDLFSRSRRSISVVASDESPDASALKLGRLSVSTGTTKIVRSGVDDLLSSDSGKNDYDWLLTPPGTPLFTPSEGSEPQPKVVAPRTSSLSRSTSTTKGSRLSAPQSEVSHHTSRPTRSSSVTRSSSLSTSQFNTYSSNNRSSSSILNTSSASVSSYTRPSSPITRSTTTARPSTPSTRSTSRPSTPSRVRPSPSTSSTEKPRPTLTSRPSTPSSRPQMSSTSTLPSTRSISRPSTPTRRNTAPSLSSSTISSISTSRVSSNSRPSSRPSSPSPRVRPPQQPIVLPDFSLNTPPNLRTTLPDRPLSAGRSRPAPSATAKGNTETAPPSTLPRRQPSPVVTRGRLSVSESNGRGGRSQSNTASDFHEPRRASRAPDLGMKKLVKNVTNAPETNGFGRNISKKSLDMAIRHMDIRNGNGNGSLRALSNTTLFPQSIRSSTSKTQSNRGASVHPNGNSDAVSENGSWIENGSVNGSYSAKLSDLDLYESSRYDAILLKEDMKNMNWLHSVDDKSEVGSIFDSGFETLPEPFGPL